MENYKYFLWSFSTIRDLFSYNDLDKFTDELIELIVNEMSIMEEKEEEYSSKDFEKFFSKIVDFDPYISTLPNTEKAIRDIQKREQDNKM